VAAIVGTKEAKELSIVRHGANQHSHVLITKNLSPAPKPVPASKSGLLENDQMDFETMKALLGMNDVTKAYFVGLSDEATAKAFLAKSEADRDAEAVAAKTKADDAAKAEADKADASKSDADKLKSQLADTQKALDDMRAERTAEKRESELEKAANSADFDGYPGGSEAVLALLKAYDGLPAAARDTSVAALKAQASLAKSVGTSEYGARDEAGLADLAKKAPASAEVEKGVLAIMEAEGCTKSAAMQKFSTAPVNKKLMGRAMQEQGVL
jgi:colicin import membrane protein